MEILSKDRPWRKWTCRDVRLCRMAITPLIKAPKERHDGDAVLRMQNDFLLQEPTLMPTGPMLYCICGAARSKSPNYGQFGRLGDAARGQGDSGPSPMPKLRRVHIDDIDRGEMLDTRVQSIRTALLWSRGPHRVQMASLSRTVRSPPQPFPWRASAHLGVRHFPRGIAPDLEEIFWRRAIIHGVDSDPACSRFAEDRVVTHIGSQTDAGLLKRVVKEMGGVDVVVDDASHRGSDQIASFEVLYPLVDENGVYICEDTRTSYWSQYGGGYLTPGTFIEYAKSLVDRLHAWYIEDRAIARDETFARMTLGIFFYDSMVVFEKRAKSIPFQCAVGRKERLKAVFLSRKASLLAELCTAAEPFYLHPRWRIGRAR